MIEEGKEWDNKKMCFCDTLDLSARAPWHEGPRSRVCSEPNQKTITVNGIIRMVG